jgi:glycosyltransferase involved in cell wall biosynthesis
MKLAIVRGAFGNPYELQNWEPVAGKHEITVFVSNGCKFKSLNGLRFRSLTSPYDYFGRTGRAIFNRIFVDSHYLLGLEKKLKGFDIAVCAETYYGYTQQCLNAKKNGHIKKVISTVWENIPFNNESIHGRKEWKQRAFKEVDHFIAVTKKAKEALIMEACDPQKITVIPMGVDMEKFKPIEAGVRRNDSIRVLMVGRLVKEKGILELAKKISGVEVKIIGGGVPYSEMPKIYQEADIFVHPVIGNKTWQEQFGMVLVEAMASGLPIITTESGSIPEVIGKAGIISNNIIFDLELLIKNKNLRMQLGKIARERAERLYDRNLIAAQYDRLITKI